MKSRLPVLTAAAAAALLLGGVCGRRLYPPEFVAVPYEVFAGDDAWVRLAAHGSGYDSVRYVVNWDDGTTDTTAPFGLADTVTVWHVWTAPDTVYVRAGVYSPDDPQGIRWAEQSRISVEAGGSHAPVIDTAFIPSRVGVRGAATTFTVRAHDPDGDSLRVQFRWDTAETTTVHFPSPCSLTVSYVFAEVETAVVTISAQDVRGAISLPDTILVPIVTAGGVKWYWQVDNVSAISTVPLCVSDGQGSLVYAANFWDHRLYSIRGGDGQNGGSAATRWPDHVFLGSSAFCEETQHIIIGSDEGELYAFETNLTKAWQWPDRPKDSLTYSVWGAPAIRDNRLYVPREDDSLYFFLDSLDHGVRVATFPAGAAVGAGPVIDAQGNVYFGTDSGYIYKVSPELDSMFWRTRLVDHGSRVRNMIVGEDGTVYCSCEPAGLYAVEPTSGVLLWTGTTYGGPSRLTAGRDAIFAASEYGNAHSIDPSTGSINWQKPVASAFSSTPALSANGYVYFLDENDVLLCLNQADGAVIWSCDCDQCLPGGGNGGRSPTHGGAPIPLLAQDLTILPDGSIVAATWAAIFCVAGYSEGPLDPLAPWPKWQHDLHNTGYVGGGK